MSGDWRARAREITASAAQYALLGGFTAVAAGISAQGLTGFAHTNMGLRGPWPYLLFFALDGAAGVCAVLLMRRAARADSGLAPRLAVWGLVAASAAFNWTHAPRRPAAPEAFGLMPVIAAVLFEFSLRELRLRTAGRADRRLTSLRWLHPAERIRVQLLLAADERMSAGAATHRARVDQAARRLYMLRRALGAPGQAARPSAKATRRARVAERRAHSALTRVGFADPDTAAQVLRQVQVLALTPRLAILNTEGPLLAMRSTAALIAGLLPLHTRDDLLRPAATPDLTQIARELPADTAYQIMRTAGRLEFEASDVLAEVVNAVTTTTHSPKARRHDLRHDTGRSPPATHATPAQLVGSSFPRPPLARHRAAAPAASASRPAAPANRLRPAQRT